MGRVDREVILGRLELSQETILEDVDFVGEEVKPLMNTAAADVANLEGVIPADGPLDAQVPRLSVRLLDIRVDRAQRDSGIVDLLVRIMKVSPASGKRRRVARRDVLEGRSRKVGPSV